MFKKRNLSIIPFSLRILLILSTAIALQSCGKNFESSEPYQVISSNIAVHGEPAPLYKKYVNEFKGKKPFSKNDLNQIIANYSETHDNSDSIDQFISLLPKTYRSKFTLVHRSYSIQKGTPRSPRVILFGQDASVMMTFNAGKNLEGKEMEGGDAIEVIAFNKEAKRWDFSEITFAADKSIQVKENPKKCVMCHSGTPKAVTYEDAEHYQGHLKPIFPQYPFWPGFYGSINDIVGIEGTIDTVMNDTDKTMAHIKSLTFSDTEELFRLSGHLEKNPKYLELVKKEEEVHKKHFLPFMDSMKSRKRYQHLSTLKDLYTENGEKVPDYLRTAPYRRTFDKEYGHYLFRPNFYLSSLMTFYHSQVVAEEIIQFPEFKKFGKSLVAHKFNCDIPTTSTEQMARIQPSFDLVYPNLSSQETMDRQYLMSYQYNLVASAKKSSEVPHYLPLFAWNLESNEEIASYHFGNVYSDLNELVLWRLASNLYPKTISFEKGRDAAQERHYKLSDDSLKNILRSAGGVVSRFTTSQLNFANSIEPFYGSERNFKAQPVSNKCKKVFVPGAVKELDELPKVEELPHNIYPIDKALTDVVVIKGQVYENNVTQNIRHNCESCHSSKIIFPELTSHISPQFNVDWYSDGFSKEMQKPLNEFQWFNKPLQTGQIPKSHGKTLAQQYIDALSLDNLPVPYGSRMPFGRRAITGLAKVCEEELVKRNAYADESLKFKVFKCEESDEDSLDCACKAWTRTKWKAYKKHYLPGN